MRNLKWRICERERAEIAERTTTISIKNHWITLNQQHEQQQQQQKTTIVYLFLDILFERIFFIHTVVLRFSLTLGFWWFFS